MTDYADTLEGLIEDAGPYDLVSTQEAIRNCERSQRISRNVAERLRNLLLSQVLAIAETKWKPAESTPEPARQRTLF